MNDLLTEQSAVGKFAPPQPDWRAVALTMLFDLYTNLQRGSYPTWQSKGVNVYTEAKEEIERFLANKIRETLPKDPTEN